MPNFFIPLDLSIRFTLVFLRIVGIVVFVPFYSHSAFPNVIKISLSIIITFAVFPILNLQGFTTPLGAISLVLVAVREVLIGFVIGFAAQLVFTGIQFGAELVTIQMGFSMATILDPNHQEQITIISQIYNFLALIIFIYIKGHYMFLIAAVDTFKFIPIGGFSYSEDLAGQIISLFSELFVVGFYVAAPVFVALFMTTVALALVSRVIPQLNVFIILPLVQVLVGTVMIIVSIRVTVVTFEFLFGELSKDLHTLIMAM